MALLLKHRQYIFYCATLFVVGITFAIPVFTQGGDDEFTQDDFTQNEIRKNDPVELFNRGQDAHAKGNLKKALKLYSAAIEANPKFPEAEYQKGIVLRDLGRLDESERSYRRAISLKNSWELPKISLGILLINKKRFKEGKETLEQVTIAHPNNVRAFVLLTGLLINQNADKAELEALLLQLQKFPKTPSTPTLIWISKARIERKLNQFNAAKASIANALKLEPKNLIARSENIELNLSGGEYRLAITESKILAVAYPNSDPVKLLLARSYSANGDSSKALEILKGIQNPNKDILNFSNSLRVNGNNDIKNLEKLLANNKNNPSILGRLCILSRSSNPQKALDYCRQALDIEKHNIKHAIGYSAALVQLKQYPKAISILQKLAKILPENYAIRANLATAFFQMKRFENAKTQYRWITKKRPNLAIAYYFLGISHDRLEEYKDALELYWHFLRLADSNKNELEIGKVELRLPILKKQIKNGKGKKKKG